MKNFPTHILLIHEFNIDFAKDRKPLHANMLNQFALMICTNPRMLLDMA